MASDVTYVRYFTAHIYQFQFYRALCLASGQYDPKDPNKPLHRCNFYGESVLLYLLRHYYKTFPTGLLNLQALQIYEKIATFMWYTNDMFHYMFK